MSIYYNMPIGFPDDADVTDINHIEPLPANLPPLSDVIIEMNSVLDGTSATDWGIKYRTCTKDKNDGNFLRGDVHSAKCRVRDAYNRCLIKKSGISEYRKDLEPHQRYKANVDQVAGYLDIAVNNFLSSALERFCTEIQDEECLNLKSKIEDIMHILRKHRDAAENGIIYEGPPVDSIL